jgi:hypothetical protein
VRYGGLVAGPRFGGLVAGPRFGGAEPAGGSGWSTGPLEDLLWARLPGLRPRLASLVAEEMELAVEQDRVLWTLSPYETCSVFMGELYWPALDGLPDTAPAAHACGRVLREILELDEALAGEYGDPLHNRVLKWLVEAEPYREALTGLDPPLAAAATARYAAPEPPPGPAEVLGGAGADAGGNPLHVPDADVGWGWVEVDAGGGRVAAERYGGIVSWSLLNVAPEPVEPPMDLGLGPLADLAWAALPATRPDLTRLAVAELDAAILADRSPLAVPGTAVADLLTAPLRDALDHVRHHPPAALRRHARTVTRLLDTDTRLTGRHHGDVAAALRWMTAEPYPTVLAATDPALLDRLRPA